MIDICIVVYCNYELLNYQIAQWKPYSDHCRLLVCDNTHPFLKRQIEIKDNDDLQIEVFDMDVEGIDGETHGKAIDFLLSKTETGIVGLCDSDFFWTHPNILKYITDHFHHGFKAVGTELACLGWGWINHFCPERASHLAPGIFSLFMERELALSETFVCAEKEAEKRMETGWRLRKKIIKEKIEAYTIPAFQYPQFKNLYPSVIETDQPWYYGTPDQPVGFHLIKGSRDFGRTAYVDQLIKFGKDKWDT